MHLWIKKIASNWFNKDTLLIFETDKYKPNLVDLLRKTNIYLEESNSLNYFEYQQFNIISKA